MSSKGKSKFHVVFYGRRPGIYKSWFECKDQVSGFSCNAHNAYATLTEAEAAWAAFCKQQHQGASVNSTCEGGSPSAGVSSSRAQNLDSGCGSD